MDWNVILGPAGVAVVAVAAVAVLWRNHEKGDERDAATIVALTASVREFPGALKDLTAVVVDAAKERAQRRD